MSTPTAIEAAAAPSALTAGRGNGWVLIFAGQIALFIGVMALWQLAHVFEWGRPIVVRSPVQVWDALLALYASGKLMPNLIATVTATGIALALATVVGVALGLGLALVPRIERIVQPYLTAFNCAPRIAFAPVFIIVFGIGTSSKVALAFSVVIFVMILSARAGVHAADQDIIKLMEVLGASKLQRFTKLLFPVAIPSIFAGFRLALIYSLLGVVTSEMIAAKDGMGQLVANFSANFELDKVYAVISCLIVIGTVLNSIAGVIERRLLWWKPAE